MKTWLRILWYWLPALLWLVVIALESIYLSSAVTGAWLWKIVRALHIPISWSAVSTFHHYLRKAGHVSGYGILCILLFRAWYHTLSCTGMADEQAGHSHERRLVVPATVLALTMTVATGALDEWHQSFDPARTSSIYDVGLDSLGAAVFLAAALFVVKARRNTPKHQIEAA